MRGGAEPGPLVVALAVAVAVAVAADAAVWPLAESAVTAAAATAAAATTSGSRTSLCDFYTRSDFLAARLALA